MRQTSRERTKGMIIREKHNHTEKLICRAEQGEATAIVWSPEWSLEDGLLGLTSVHSVVVKSFETPLCTCQQAADRGSVPSAIDYKRFVNMMLNSISTRPTRPDKHQGWLTVMLFHSWALKCVLENHFFRFIGQNEFSTLKSGSPETSYWWDGQNMWGALSSVGFWDIGERLCTLLPRLHRCLWPFQLCPICLSW